MKRIFLIITRILNKISPKLNTKIIFKLKMKRKLNLKNPELFNDKISWMKLNVYNNNERVSKLADKYAVRNYIKNLELEDILIELYGVYNSPTEIDFDKLPEKYVIKWNFGCGFNYIVKNNNDIDRDKVIKELNKMRKNKRHLSTSELQYEKIDKKIIIEKYIEDKQGNLNDYKFYCFNGVVKTVMLCIDRQNNNPKFYLLDRELNLLKLTKDSLTLEKDYSFNLPENMEKAFKYAEKISQGIPFVRVDLYNVDGEIYFGEMTFTPSAGIDSTMTIQEEKYLGDQLTLKIQDNSINV